MRSEVLDGRPWVCTEAEQRELDDFDRRCKVFPAPRWSSIAPSPGPVVVNIVTPVDVARPTLAEVDPCRAGAHRPAYLGRGGVACGRCGVRLG